MASVTRDRTPLPSHHGGTYLSTCILHAFELLGWQELSQILTDRGGENPAHVCQPLILQVILNYPQWNTYIDYILQTDRHLNTGKHGTCFTKGLAHEMVKELFHI